MSETLSPSEVQSLFAGLVLAGATELQGRTTSTPDPIWAGDQFTLPMALDGEELAARQTWQAAFGRDWSRAWTEPFASRCTLQNLELQVIRLRDFVSRHVAWQGFQVTSSQLGFPVWLALDQPLMAAHLDCLLGGNLSAADDSQRAHGPLEQQLTGRLVQSVCEALLAAGASADWQITAVNSADDWIEGIPVYLSCEIVQFDFEVVSSGAIGHLSLGVPRGACHRLHSPYAPRTTPGQTTVQLRVTLAPISLSPTELLDLQVGDVLLTAQNDQAPCLVSWDGQQRFLASIGSHQAHKAIQLIAPVD